MRFGHGPVMSMLVVRVVDMTVLVFQPFVLVIMRVTFGKMQPEPCPHQHTGHEQPDG